ncbi:hypothetical protein [Arenimonas sp.]|uniref:hypothetical protein n=1 Tax=Arenimonas sp. TaxID=1872635 RepID=UPI0039E49FA0
MRIVVPLGKLLCLALLGAGGHVEAKLLEAKIATVKTGAGSMQDVRLALEWPEGAEQGELRLQAGTLDFPTLSYKARDVDWRCPVRRDADQRWRCSGPVRTAASKAAFPLSLDLSPAGTQAQLRVRDSLLAYETRSAAPDLSRIRAERIPVDWLKAYLAGLWSTGRWTQGKLSGRVDILTPEKGPFEVRADLQASGLGLETPDGMIAAAGVNGRIRVDYREQRGAQQVDTRLSLSGGELLVQSLYAVLPKSPIEAQVLMRRDSAKAHWRLPTLSWRDPGVLEASGQGLLDGAGDVSELDLRLALPDLAQARDRYLSGFLAPAGFPDLVLSGRMDAEVDVRDAKPQRIRANLHGINAIDRNARFTFAGVDGDLRWTQASTPESGKLSWNSAAIYGIGLGPAQAAFQSANGEFRLQAPTSLAVLDGSLGLSQFRWQAPTATASTRIDLGLEMTALDLASLSQRLGWPAFTGKLGGSIPAAHYQDNVLTLDGGLRMDLFGGHVRIDHLVMERPFGVAPTLSGDVAIEDIDMEPMTRVVGFGWISGRLDGRIDKLRLVDWSPSAFDAWLETDRSWKGKRRISQRAVNDISSVGGSGLGGGLQAQALKVFKDFGYDRIGIGCKLADNVCQMSGLGSAGDGYIIVAGAGLPRIQVVGFRRRVDWPTLVARLQAATAGQAPIIE